MKELALILKALIRSRLRWAKTHIYAWAILAPIVVGITYWSVSRVAGNLSTAQLTFAQTLAVAVGFCALLVALNLSSASAELFHIRRPEFYFEVLPVDTDTHLNAALAARLLRTGVVGVVLLSLKWLLRETVSVRTLLPLLLFILLVTVTELFAALNWIHWGHTRDKPAAGVALLITILAVLLAGSLLTLSVKSLEIGYWSLFPVTLAAVGLLYLTTRALHRKWRALDIEYARRLQSPGGFTAFAEAPLARRLSPTVAAQLARDLQLTLRGFSSAVYVVACVGVSLLVALFAALATDVFPPITTDYGWFDVMRAEPVTAVKIACALLVTALASMVPALVAYQLPYLWLERAAGTTGLDMFHSKLAYARLVSLPAPLLAFATGVITGAVPAYYLVVLFAECLLLWWAIASLIGALSYEMPTRPGLALIIMLTMGVAGGVGASLSLLTSAFVLIGFYFYAQTMHGLTERGRARAKYFLMFGDD